MAWMAMLGADSVGYHRDNVVARGDDHPGQALAYYASRGETPLRWGGSGAERFGLAGAVTDAQYAALFGPGGACDPTTGERLVSTRRPGIDLVVSAHKSVAELGVIGRPDDMHAILDAERDATLGYLDGMVRAMGGRRGRARTTTPTDGLVYAHTRHATSRAGDPCPHDHVLVANLVEMRDDAGGAKALDTAAVRDHLHAATMVGRLAAARRAVELGYAIEPDHGASGRLGHWRIVGIPAEVEQVHSKRSEEIHAYLARRGHGGWRARQVAARKTRDTKRHTPVTDLLPAWQAELAAVGWSPDALIAAVTDAGQRRAVSGPLTAAELHTVVTKVVDGDGPLARAKVFHRRDVVVAVTPLLFGRPTGEWRRAVDAVLASPEAIPLLPVAGARGRAWSLASVIATEQAIADQVARGTADPRGGTLDDETVAAAVDATQRRLGRALTDGQRRAVWGICTSGERVSLVLGVAGAGKTTALRCVADAHRAAGYTVIGTATSGQAARTLGREAGLDTSRTLASLCWRLDHHQLELHPRSLVMLDEAGMTDDPDLLRLLAACEIAGAKLVLVGDDRQLSAVGPGGALGALLERHGGHAYVLDENLRQHDPAERAALADLRDGNTDIAVAWYLTNDRVHVSPDRDEVLSAMVDAWGTDALAGRDTAMYAWQRRNVDALNALARERWTAEGRLTGPELVAPGGRRYQAGDRIVTLSGGRDTVTSERGTVIAARPDDETLVARMDDGRFVRLVGDDLDRAHLAHGYALTVHRAQGETVDVAHRFEDGGGRELAYVAMSRARAGSHVWVVADDLDQAREDLQREWSHETRARWAIDTAPPDRRTRRPWTEPEQAIDRAKLAAQWRALISVIPPDPRHELRAARAQLAVLTQTERDLEHGEGIWRDTTVGRVARHLHDLNDDRQRAERQATDPNATWRERRHARATAQRLSRIQDETVAEFEPLSASIRERLDEQRDELLGSIDSLEERAAERQEWLAQHPEAQRRLDAIVRELRRVDPWAASRNQPERSRDLGAERHQAAAEVDLGPELGI